MKTKQIEQIKINKYTKDLAKKYDLVRPQWFEIWKDNQFLSNYPNYRLKWKKFTDLYDDYYYISNSTWKGAKNFATFEEANQYCKRKGFDNYTIKLRFLCSNFYSEGSTHWSKGWVNWKNIYTQ